MGFDELRARSAELYQRLHDVARDYFLLWRDYQLFAWRWWVALAIVVFSWVLWFAVRRKESSHRLLLAGFTTIVIGSLSDLAGTLAGLWYYPVSVLPLMPCFIIFNLCILPVATMLFIQFLPQVRPVWKAAAYALVGSYGFQPAMQWLGFVEHAKWPYYYSIPILFLIYLAANWLYAKSRFEPVK